MRVTLIHNPTSGEGRPSAAALMAWLCEAGHEPEYHSTKAAGLGPVLQDPGDLVVIAGGDGTVCEVARQLRRHGTGVPITLLPVGTANNVARALGLYASPRELVEGLERGRRVRLDVGVVEGLGAERRFIEAAGFGGFAEMMAFVDSGAHRRTRESIERCHGLDGYVRLLRKRVQGRRARGWRVEIDGADVSGRYILVEIMNIRYVGPNLLLAPDAHPDDGVFDVVLVAGEDAALLDAHLAARLCGAGVPTPLPVRRGRRVRLARKDAGFHVDDEICRTDRAVVEVRVDPGALDLLIPARVPPSARKREDAEENGPG